MGLTSALNEVEDALKAAIVAQAALVGNPLAGVLIEVGWPARLMPEHIWIADEAEIDQEWETTQQLGGVRGSREEHLSLRVHVFTQQTGDDFVTLRDRHSAMAEEVEKVIRQSPTIGGSAFDGEVNRIEREGGPVSDVRELHTTLHVAATAFLS